MVWVLGGRDPSLTVWVLCWWVVGRVFGGFVGWWWWFVVVGGACELCGGKVGGAEEGGGDAADDLWVCRGGKSTDGGVDGAGREDAGQGVGALAVGVGAALDGEGDGWRAEPGVELEGGDGVGAGDVGEGERGVEVVVEETVLELG